ncbi:glycosyltransferase family 2 protein [Actinokineospora globicatena]|uniref:Glycosyl transferase n=1 Tax=Actinokineospora globicatena TaxID=103729 RepID=A0A9W6V9N9_9PSEU|nr:glycosyltransferase family 2 protein [Actinokineospora globicatena]MCP2302093.1 N-acetylglucosaminyl-diphospho-decaprenol L-rhamnosyltransferase [Actinokineospora globicatena]GLW76245.1 glycosyl transferase [Actinokineospora globicatena]GLW83081.1 glycosyl transferase [Actinokineospora globicatena]GLW95360.1 glycosyl transferase [Actinokineospora globicatena]
MTAEPTAYGDRLAVVTVTYSPGDTLERFVQTLAAATSRDVRVVLADNGSVDGAPEAAAAAHDHVDLVRTGGNLGYGGGANRGVAALGPEYGWVVVANPDLEWAPGSLDDLLAAAERWPRGGSFGPLITERDGAVYPSAREVPSLSKGIGHGLLGKVWPANPWTRAYKQSATDVREREAGWLSGSCLLLRRAAFDSVDGFDTRYFMYFEDVDLGERLSQAGWQNVYVPSASVMHIQGVSTAKVSEKMLVAHHDSAYRFIADRHRGPAWAPLRLAIKAGLAVRLRLETR